MGLRARQIVLESSFETLRQVRAVQCQVDFVAKVQVVPRRRRAGAGLGQGGGALSLGMASAGPLNANGAVVICRRAAPRRHPADLAVTGVIAMPAMPVGVWQVIHRACPSVAREPLFM